VGGGVAEDEEGGCGWRGEECWGGHCECDLGEDFV
jgi:hypothetical protein